MPVTEANALEAKQIIDRVEFVIDSGCPTGEYNRANADLISYARENGKRIITTLKELSEVS